jgi:DNA-binding protein Fis
MTTRLSGTALGSAGRHGSLVRCISLIFALVVLFPAAGFSKTGERLVESREYKDKDFHKGIITDYKDMVEGDRVDWVWVKPSTKLSGYKVTVESIRNKSDSHSKSLVESVKSIFKSSFRDLKGSKDTLTAEMCIYEVQGFSPGKAWIPYAGGHQMQAGIGIEVILRDRSNKTIAKFRQFDRQGSDVKAAAQEVADHLVNYISKH